jgi:hypothetical protein
MKQRLLMVGLAILILMGPIPGFGQGNPGASQINTITDEGVVVLGDVTYTIAPDARFFAQDERSPISISAFNEGDWVGFSVNADGQIDEMWLSSE